MRFASASEKGPIPASGRLITYNNNGDNDPILTLIVPEGGLYWVSFYTETWQNWNQTGAVESTCRIYKENYPLGFQSMGSNKHFLQTLVRADGGEEIILYCAQTLDSPAGRSFNSSGYLLRVGN